MPQKDYVNWLAEGIFLAVGYETHGGRVVSFVVLLMIHHEGCVYNVARYDTAHGTPHRDILSKSNSVIEKYLLDNMEFDEALTYAIDDFKENYENYIAIWKKL
jgi:hypothetical protein